MTFIVNYKIMKTTLLIQPIASKIKKTRMIRQVKREPHSLTAALILTDLQMIKLPLASISFTKSNKLNRILAQNRTIMNLLLMNKKPKIRRQSQKTRNRSK